MKVILYRSAENLEMESFPVLAPVFFCGGAVELDVISSWCRVYPTRGAKRQTVWNADQVIGDQIEQEVGGDASDATMFGLVCGGLRL